MKHYLFILFLILTLGFGCKKTEQVEVNGNTAPPDQTISTVTIENYINKTYISVLGKKPDSLTFSKQYTFLKSTNVSQTSRYIFLDSVFADKGYKDHVYDQLRADVLGNLDTIEIKNREDVYKFILTDSAYQSVWQGIKEDYARLDSLRVIPQRYKKGSINISEMHKRCCNNYFYEQLNMGALNYVIATFQHFAARTPSYEEQFNGANMCDDKPGTLFYKNGASKTEFLNIFFTSDNYYEGVVYNLFIKYLYRPPLTEEMSSLTTKYKSTLNYEQIQKEILATNEFVGIK